jgi:predicted TIM-barrel fold metal-dependent hydrolase
MGGWPWINERLGVAFKHPNVFVSPDIYFFALAGNRYVEAIGGPLQDQFLFASAFPLRALVQTVRECQKFSIGEGATRKFFSENAHRLLGTHKSWARQHGDGLGRF